MEVSVSELESWLDLAKYKKHGWIYRGQNDESRGLSTSLDRCLDRHSIRPGDRPPIEAELLREFRRAYHQYGSHLPAEQNTLEWLSLMQHHGAPTRLLDFSYSIYVAAYFAVEDAKSQSAIWAINGPWAFQQTYKLFKDASKPCRLLDVERIEERDEESFNETYLQLPCVPSVCPLNPYRLNERLRLQKGVFLIPGDITQSFETNLSALSGYNSAESMLKIVIPESLKRELTEQLYYMNITRMSLFPGLDGFCKALGMYHPVFNPVNWSERT
jgi:hypothetical protein